MQCFWSPVQVCGLIIAYILTAIKFWSDENKVMLGYLAIPLWLVIMLCVIANAGALRLPLAVVILALIAMGIYTDSKEGANAQKQAKKPALESPGTYSSIITSSNTYGTNSCRGLS